ncbi:MAG: hypothetical protein ACR2JQ_04295 [Mycobacteriales bacterium]
MLGLLVLGFPVVLLGFLLFMERVESPLRGDAAYTDEATTGALDAAAARGSDSIVRQRLARAGRSGRSRRRHASRRLPALGHTNRGR